MVMRPRHYIALGSLSALLAAFGILSDEVAEGDTAAFDNAILMALRDNADPSHPIGGPWVEEAVRDITALGSFSVLTILVVGVVSFLALSGKNRTAWLLSGSVLGGTLVSTVLKMLFDRPRPEIEGVARVFTASFPSGHATISAVVYLTLGAILAEIAETRRLKIFFFSGAVFLTVLIGLSRIYLGVHFPTDVLAGWSIGSAWALICWMVVYIIRHASRGTAVPSSAQGRAFD